MTVKWFSIDSETDPVIICHHYTISNNSEQQLITLKITFIWNLTRLIIVGLFINK